MKYVIKNKILSFGGGSTVTRNSKPIYSGASSDGQGANFEFYVGEESGQTQNSSTYRKYENSAFQDELAWTVPYVKVRCELTRSGTFSGLTVRSVGRDGVENGTNGETSRDDIIVR